MKQIAIAAALTWDGARVPIQGLPREARAFLNAGKATLPSAKKVGKLFAANVVKEIRICWVPQLRGGTSLTEPFTTSKEKRLPFRATQSKPFGNILGVIYRPSPQPTS